MTAVGRLVSVNVGVPRVVEWFGRAVESGIWKEPVPGRVSVRGVNLDGDEQADLRVHGGVDKAVYAYALEDYSWWSERLGRTITPATFGENLTTDGIDLNALEMGTRVHVGSVTLEVSGPRMPCFKLGMRMGDADFVDEFEQAARFGAYFRIVTEGAVGAGDEIAVEPLGRDGLTVRELGSMYHSPTRSQVERVRDDPATGATWREWIEYRSRRASG